MFEFPAQKTFNLADLLGLTFLPLLHLLTGDYCTKSEWDQESLPSSQPANCTQQKGRTGTHTHNQSEYHRQKNASKHHLERTSGQKSRKVSNLYVCCLVVFNCQKLDASFCISCRKYFLGYLLPRDYFESSILVKMTLED